MTRGPTHVLLVSPLPPPAGGIARWTQLVTDRLRSHGDVRVRILDTSLRLRSPQSASRTRRIGAGSAEALWTIVRCVFITVTRRPDVVHVNVAGQLGLLRDLLVIRWCRAIRLPVVVHLRFGRVPDLARSHGWEWIVLLRVINHSSLVVAIDERTAKILSMHSPSTPVRLIPNCVELSESSADGPVRTKDVLFVGWVVPSKGIEELLEAWPSARTDGATLRLMGGFEKQYVADLESRGLLSADIELVGEAAHDQVLKAMRTCGLFVLPSHTEGFPNVVVEAMSVGAPIVATSVGAIPDMLAEGAGVTVPPRDGAALSIAMRDTLADPDRLGMGERARHRAESQYSVDAVTRQYTALWKRVAAEGRASADSFELTDSG